MTLAEVDNAKAEAFAGKLLEMVNGGCMSLMIGIGHKTGLFDTLSKLQVPSNSEEIAKSSNLNERYVREWLGAMVAGGIINYESDSKRYHLPPEHAAYLTRAAGINNISLFSQYISLLGMVEEKVVECFRKGGGVPYSDYPSFQALQSEETSRIFDARLIDQIIPLAGDELVEMLRKGVDVLDIGCGQGHALNLMARAFPNSKFVGYDMSEEGIESGRKEAREMNLTNTTFEIKDVAALNETQKFNLITAFDTIHDQAHPLTVLENVYNALKNGGIFLMQDIAASSNIEENIKNPLAPSLYTFSTMHRMTVSLAQGGEGWGTVWGHQMAEQKLKEAGFSGNIQIKQIDGDILNFYYIAKKEIQ